MGIELLQDQVEHGLREHMLHIATHFSNLVKVSERVGVRHAAGEALVRLIPLLRREQRNEVVVELGKGLEMGQYQISKYIPEYLGRAALFLHPSELDEQVLWLKNLLGSPTNIAVSGALNTVGVLLQHYPAYRGRFPEPERAYEARRQELLGLLLQGLAHYREEVRQEALLVTGTMLFDSPVLSMEEKSRLFSPVLPQAPLPHPGGPPEDPLTFFYRASALAHINRFIALRRLDKGPFAFSQPRKIAFSPAPLTPSPCPTRASPTPFGRWASRYIWRWTSSPGPKAPAPHDPPADRQLVHRRGLPHPPVSQRYPGEPVQPQGPAPPAGALPRPGGLSGGGQR